MDIVKILKNFPENTELYSTVYGEVLFLGIVPNSDYPIRVKVKKSDIEIVEFTSSGSIYKDKGECTLFLSKTHRNWNKLDTLYINTPVMISFDSKEEWRLANYIGRGEATIPICSDRYTTFIPTYIVPVKQFNFEGTYKENIKKSII